jgi:hypothetical protein
MKLTTATLLLITSIVAYPQTRLAPGKQPQLAIDVSGTIRLIFGEADKIYAATSTDGGKSFSSPGLVGEVAGMHLGHTRGPQLASSKDFSLVAAMDKTGNIHAFLLTHKTGKWEKIQNVNSVNGSAPEGLMDIGANDDNTFYATWLDLREGRNNNICFASLENETWSENRFVYRSNNDHVCDCCKPSVTAKGKTVSVMFRNWLNGARDLYLATSTDGGKTFSQAQKLGKGTWQSNACPMDGGGLLMDNAGNTHTFWRRDNNLYYAQPGGEENRISAGRGAGIGGGKNVYLTWEENGSIRIQNLNGAQTVVAQGSAARLVELETGGVVAVWENDEQVWFKTLSVM